MSASSDKLREMINNVEDQVEGIDSSITQIQAQIDDLQAQDDAIVDGILDIVAPDLETYLNDVKLPGFPGGELIIGPTYNVIEYEAELTDWEIRDSTSLNPLYQYEGIGWDGDTDIISFVTEWDFGNDYLTRPLTTGASYGIRPYKASLESAKSLLEDNKDKIEESETVFEGFAS
ncbi:MAG: hypothetical protein V3W20_02510 [Candidatus Neomarinimicrobiota bacterium]